MPGLIPELQFALQTASPFDLYSWPQFGPVTDGAYERTMRVCPLCLCTVPNESQVMRGHVEYHQRRMELPDALHGGVTNG